MKKVCKYLTNEIQFVSNRIVPCGSRFWDSCNTAEKYFIKPDKNIKSIDFDLYFKQRAKYIKMYQNGLIPEFCNNCSIYAPVESNENISETNKFKAIHINHKTICSCRCIYCCIADNGNLEKFKIINKEVTYDIKPILSQIERLKLIDENTKICLFGGECTEYPEDLEYIINFGISNNCKFLIASNCIIYDKNIEKLLKMHNVELRLSLDSGTKETYEKIKRVKAFERVISNIEQYSIAAKNNPNASIQLKYIICPGLNDNIDELKAFFEIALRKNCNCVILSINRFWLMKNQNKKVPAKIEKLIKYYFNNKAYRSIIRTTDPDELWDWWVKKILNKKSFVDKILQNFHLKF